MCPLDLFVGYNLCASPNLAIGVIWLLPLSTNLGVGHNLFAFPRYTSSKGCNANSASAALNKWLKEKLFNDYVVHGFRHSFRDRLRAVECPSDSIDAIGGWKTFGVGQGYGSGYGLDVKYKWMNLIALK